MKNINKKEPQKAREGLVTIAEKTEKTLAERTGQLKKFQNNNKGLGRLGMFYNPTASTTEAKQTKEENTGTILDGCKSATKKLAEICATLGINKNSENTNTNSLSLGGNSEPENTDSDTEITGLEK